jgi:hypothetical protein
MFINLSPLSSYGVVAVDNAFKPLNAELNPICSLLA